MNKVFDKSTLNGSFGINVCIPKIITKLKTIIISHVYKSMEIFRMFDSRSRIIRPQINLIELYWNALVLNLVGDFFN